jgi:hypothetical protein
VIDSEIKHTIDKSTNRNRIVAALLFSLLAVLLVGCRQSAQPTATPDPDIVIALDLADQRAGKSTLIVFVRDARGIPIDDAKVEIVGDMSHAGMKPSLGSVERGREGRYEVPFEWTMSGDWIVTVKVTLPDGRTSTKRFETTIALP